MSKKIVSMTLICVFLLSAFGVASVAAQPRIVGVAYGNLFTFGDVSVSWSSNDPSATVPEFLEDFNNTEWIQMLVVDISGTNVTFQWVTHAKNGTEKTEGYQVDIDTGLGNATMAIISANLNVGDSLYTSGSYSSSRINETITRIYPDETRVTNHFNVTTEYNVTGVYSHLSTNYYWDRPTGMLVQMSQEATMQVGENITAWGMSIAITDSNAWVVPEFPTCLFIPLVLIVLTVAIIFHKQRLLKKPIY